MKLLTNIINLLLYGNFWIAFGAVALTFQTQYLLGQTFLLSPLVLLAFFATLFIYAAHRIIGLQKVQAFADKGRYLVISKYKKHIFFYAFLGFIGSLVSFFYIKLELQMAIVLPALLSLGYVIPFLKNKKRLRDINNIKIFLVAFVWAWVTVLLPILEQSNPDYWLTFTMFLERFCFVFAITLPFDIRDWKVDKHIGVKTIPVLLGIPKTKQLAYVLLGFSMLLSLYNYGVSNLGNQIGMFVALGITAYLIHLCDKRTDDYFFTGLLDGTMIFQVVLIWGFGWLL